MTTDKFVIFSDIEASERANEEPLLTVLNFSGGKQSSAILWMVLRGDIPRPDPFLVLHADPGMENSQTYDYVGQMFEECRKAGIDAQTVEGPNLYEDLTQPEGIRIDNPPYWTRDEKGKVGRLVQKCTRHYKIAPMDRALREYMESRFGISRNNTRMGYGIVEKWIGFSFNEVHRVKPPTAKYQRFAYPLIGLGMRNSDVIDYFLDNDLPIPPRSVCNACFANGLETLKEMFEHRPEDWKQAVAVDRAVRDMQQFGVEEEVYVSKTALPLEDLPEMDFELPDELADADDYSCDSGFCFV